ncbi:hypothetical protein ACGC1H_006630 [Rhizoctonia solani]
MQSINELPVEVLSRVFILGENMQRGPRAIGLPYMGFQDLVVQVCHLWREVAISTPDLWTYIFISHPPPHLHAALYISRSGAFPLHIDLDMRTPFMRPIDPSRGKEQAERALEALEFIEKAGGTRDRWGSLIIFSKALLAIISIYSFFTRTPTPALRFVSIKWRAHDGTCDDQARLGAQKFRLDQMTLAHGPERPQLCHVEINGLPRFFTINQRSALVSNLTRFTIIFSATTSLPFHRGFSAIFSASPRLEHFSVDMRATLYSPVEIELGPATISSLQVHLPLLRSFSPDTGHLYQWSLDLLRIMDAPGVEDFDINIERGFSDLTLTELHQYLAKGRINGVLQCYVPPNDNILGSGAIFPLLEHLNVKRMYRGVNNVSRIFAAFPMVTKVTFGGIGVLTLYEHPKYLPNAFHFTYIDEKFVKVPLVTGLLNNRAKHKVISTWVWCTDRSEELCMQLHLETPGICHSGSDRHYHSLPELHVDHLIIRQVAKAFLHLGRSDDAVLAT